MHSSLAATTEGLPLGLCAVRFWTRKDFKGCNKLKKSINPMRVPIEEKESIRWLKSERLGNQILRVNHKLCVSFIFYFPINHSERLGKVAW